MTLEGSMSYKIVTSIWQHNIVNPLCIISTINKFEQNKKQTRKLIWKRNWLHIFHVHIRIITYTALKTSKIYFYNDVKKRKSK